MEKKLREFFKKLNKEELSDIKNGKAFELYFLNLLVESGFPKNTNIKQKNCKEEIKSLHKLLTTYKTKNDLGYEDCVIYQPFSSQKFPDYIVVENDFIYQIEVKSNQKNKTQLMWNAGPKDGVYIYANNYDITYFLGRNIFTEENEENIQQKLDNLKEITKEEYETNERWNVYFRKTVKEKSHNYFTATDRKTLENNVINSI